MAPPQKAGIFYPCFFDKSGDFLSCFLKRGFCFFCPFKNRAILAFFCFPCFFPHYPRFVWPIPAFFGKKAGKGGSGNSQDLQHQGQSVERIKRTLFDEVQEKVNHLEEKFRMVGDHMDGVAKTKDRNEHSKCASIAAMIREQADVRRLVEELEKRLDQPQEMSSTMQSEFSTAVQLEISDLKAKALRLTEQGTEQDGKLTLLASMSEQVELMEQQIIKWRYRLPDFTHNSRECVVIVVEVQEDLYEFKDTAMRKIRELATTLTALEGEVRLFEQDREESWEAVSHKVSTLVDDSVSALTEPLSELEHTVQSRMTTPVTEESVTHVEVWSTIEQALMSEIGKVKDEHTRAMTRVFDMCEKLHENQKSQERQLTGLRSFAQQVEQFLNQLGGGATAPGESRRVPRLEGVRPNMPQGNVAGASASSSMRPPSYLQTPRPPTVPALPVPRESTPASGENSLPSEPSRVGATHFSTVRSEVRSGAIRIDISNPEQSSAGDTAILRSCD